jgi:NMT1/THI5 like
VLTREAERLYLQKKYTLDKTEQMTYNGQLANFMADESAVTQCFISSEPPAATKQGAKVAYLKVADSGFNPYTNVIGTNEQTIKDHPEIVQAFVTASLAGWKAYVQDPTAALAYIKVQNKDTDAELATRGTRLDEGHSFTVATPWARSLTVCQGVPSGEAIATTKGQSSTAMRSWPGSTAWAATARWGRHGPGFSPRRSSQPGSTAAIIVRAPRVRPGGRRSRPRASVTQRGGRRCGRAGGASVTRARGMRGRAVRRHLAGRAEEAAGSVMRA